MIVSSSWRMLPFDLVSQKQRERFLSALVGKAIVLATQRPQIAIFSVNFPWVFTCRSLFNEAAYLAALRRLRSPFAIRDAESKQPKTQTYDKTHLLLRNLAVIGRYGPCLMIVTIFVTQINF